MVCMLCCGAFPLAAAHSLSFPVSSLGRGLGLPSVLFLVHTATFVIGAMLYWYTIVCCYFYDTFCYFSVIRILVQKFYYFTLLRCAFSVISTIVLYVPHVEIKRVVLSRRPAGRPRPSSQSKRFIGFPMWDFLKSLKRIIGVC